MSIHINASAGDIAPLVLLPGDPLRARFIAERFLTDVVCYNEVRGMYGFTGTHRGQRISVQGTGMGMPSASIYTTELIQEFGCKTLVRVGSCGAIQEHVNVRDLILAIGASTDSAMGRPIFGDAAFAPTATFELLRAAHEYAENQKIPVHVGNVFTTDTFYTWGAESHQVWRQHGVLAVEMETAALYTLASRFGCRALSILTVSDHVISGESSSSAERETTFERMVEAALQALVQVGAA